MASSETFLEIRDSRQDMLMREELDCSRPNENGDHAGRETTEEDVST